MHRESANLKKSFVIQVVVVWKQNVLEMVILGDPTGCTILHFMSMLILKRGGSAERSEFILAAASGSTQLCSSFLTLV